MKWIFKLIGNVWKRFSRRGNEAADAVYSGSSKGISDAFDDAQDALIRDYKQMEEAVAQVMGASEQYRVHLDGLNSKEDDLIQTRDGALQLAMKEPENKAKHQAAYERLQGEISSIEIEQAQYESLLASQEEQLAALEMQLRGMQREIAQLPAEKAKEIAAYVSNQKLIEAFDRINGLKTSYDRGPLDAIRKRNAELSNQAKVKQRVARVDARAEDDEYRQAAQTAKTNTDFEEQLAALRAEKDSASDEAVEKQAERPEA